MQQSQYRTPFKGEGFDVVCPQCKGRFHETTEFFDNRKPANGTMFVLKKRYGVNGYNWSAFPQSGGMRAGDLECPQCGALYCNGGFYIKHVDPTPGFVPTAIIPDEPGEVAGVEIKLENEKTAQPEKTKKVPGGFFVCEYCGKECKSEAGLVSHRKACKAKSSGNEG